MVERINNTSVIKNLFDGWEESCIWSCLEGIMGDIYATSDMLSAKAILGDFCYFAGTPNKEIVEHAGNYRILVPRNKEWAKIIKEVYGDNAEISTRYAIKKEKDIFDVKQLQNAINSLSSMYELKLIDSDLYNECLKHRWSRDFVSNYSDYKKFEKYGLGVVALKNNELIAGASSYSGYSSGIEIEIVTRKDYRRQGLAYACASKLILECIERDLMPCWDARTTTSVALAQKLGYHFSHEYQVFIIE